MTITEPKTSVKSLSEHVKTIDECKQAIRKWNEKRWCTEEVISYFNEGWAFCISREIFNYIDTESKDNALRGYLGIFNDALHLIILNTALDKEIYEGKVTEANLYVAPYIKMGLKVNEILKKEGNLFQKMRRWVNSFEEYVTIVIESNMPGKSNSNGLVRLFEIRASDIVNEFQDQSDFVYTFVGLKKGNLEADIDLIFMGVSQKLNPLHQVLISPDDFTTPRPPFGIESDYGLL